MKAIYQGKEGFLVEMSEKTLFAGWKILFFQNNF